MSVFFDKFERKEKGREATPKKGEKNMTVSELARKYRVRLTVLYRLIYDLEFTTGNFFTRIGRKITFTPNEVEIVEKELQKRGYMEVMANV
ncbi:MAG: hypothetical protein PHP84_12495 [Mesotoga sp.]|nr:hypothetical protein [Mesotoga sp.]MDD4478999.1 hypothetical protein [Mesotoga sp.]